MEPTAPHKRMILVATVVVVALTAALFVVTPQRTSSGGVEGDGATSAGATGATGGPRPVQPEEGAPGGMAGGPGAPCGTCGEDAPLCLSDPALPAGVCTRRCRTGSDCPTGWCCLDTQGAADARFILCAPPAVCAGRVTGTRRSPDAMAPP